MTTATGALAAVKARLGASLGGISIYYQNESVTLPDTPAAFAYVELENFGSGLGPASFGGGSGANRYRNQAVVAAYVFAPNGEGAEVAMNHAETIAAQLRSYRDADVSFRNADVRPIGAGSNIEPPGLNSEVGNYWCAVAECSFFFDQIG